uniref:Uncharacterized protein n=1 Tax=Aegilops tauschii subsp. strangulata TaxID=200361 RepID=A0A453BVA7_AEGTS
MVQDHTRGILNWMQLRAECRLILLVYFFFACSNEANLNLGLCHDVLLPATSLDFLLQ